MVGHNVLVFPRAAGLVQLRQQRNLVLDLDLAVDAARLEAPEGGDNELLRDAIHRRDVATAELELMIGQFNPGGAPGAPGQGGVS